jgi:dTMP kinase
VLANRVLDKFEQERVDFHERVRLAYLERAHTNPSRIRVVNADNTMENIRKQLEQIVTVSCL